MQGKKYFIHIFAVLLVLTWASVSMATTTMPAFTLENAVTGQSMDSSSLEGKTVLITFFATWCPPCREEIPGLNALYSKYQQDGFMVLAISIDQVAPSEVKKFVEKQQISYPVVMSTEKIIQEFGGVYAIPSSFLVNKKGQIVKHYPGFQDESQLEKDIRQVL